jgi:hypothetical protein
MARTLNLSETGVKLETHEPIESRYVVFLAIGIGNEIFDIKGKVVLQPRVRRALRVGG